MQLVFYFSSLSLQSTEIVVKTAAGAFERLPGTGARGGLKDPVRTVLGCAGTARENHVGQSLSKKSSITSLPRWPARCTVI